MDEKSIKRYRSFQKSLANLRLSVGADPNADFDGLKQKIVDMLGGESCKIEKYAAV